MKTGNSGLNAPVCLAAALLSVLLFSGAAWAADYWVAPSGSDSNPGARTAPLKTIGKGLSLLKQGDTLTVAPGVYKESNEFTGTGTKEEPITIRGLQGAEIQATGRDGILFSDCYWVNVENLKVTGAKRAGFLAARSSHVAFKSCVSGDNGVWGIQTTMSDHVSVEKCELYGSKEQHGVYFSTTDYPTVIDSSIHDNASCGVHMNGDLSEGGDGVITGAYIARNKIIGNGAKGGAAINMDGVEKSTIEKNVCDRNLAGGIVSFKTDAAKAGSNNKFLGNVVRFEPGKGRFGIQLAGGSTKAYLEQNTIAINNGPAVSVDEASAKGFKSSFNLYDGLGGRLTFWWKGRTLEFREWQAATGQDADSHVVEKAPAAPGPAK